MSYFASRQGTSLFWAFVLAVAAFVPALALDIDLSGEPTFGPDNAPVVIVMFYDFQCGHCKKTAPVILDVLKQYGDLVKLVAVNVPAPGNAYAEPAAEVALTAHDQGKFWDAFRLLFENQSRLSPDYFRSLGKELELADGTVERNLEQHAHRHIIKRDFYQALYLGVSATPTVFINDAKIVGYHEADVFRYHINAELKRKGIESPVGPVAEPLQTKPGKEVPKDLIYAVKPMPATDSTLRVGVGDPAPDFTLPTISGGKITLSEYIGKKNVVLSFVPAAWTPVCSAQWPEYNENKDVFDKANAVLIGITADNVPSLYSWCSTMGDLWFPVASDFFPHGEAASKYGVLRSTGETERALFVIDDKGIIRYVDVHDINTKPDFEILKRELEKLGS